MSDKINMQCPKCGGSQMWDNRLSKKNPKAPDMKCVDKACDGVIWPPKNGAPAPTAAAPAASAKQAFNSGPHIPGIDGPYQDTASQPTTLDKLFNLHSACLGYAMGEAKKMDASGVGSSPESIAAIAATVFIAAKDKGLAA